jgi:hypothetical protein
MPITSSPFVYTPQMQSDVQKGFGALATAFAPPSASDDAAYARAGLDNQKRSIIEKLRSDPHYQGADAGVLADLFDPTSSFYAQDQNDATKRRGQDIQAQTDIATNANTVRGAAISNLFGALNQGQVRPDVPADVAATIGLPAMGSVAGAPKPLSEDEVKGIILRDMTPASVPTLTNEQLVGIATKGVGTQNVVGPDGKPKVVYDAQAVGQQPAYAPNKEIVNNNEGYGAPGDGLVWARDPAGDIKLDDRGAPIAIPYQGGKLFNEQQQADKTAAAQKQNADTKGGVVVQDIDRTLDQIESNPLLTTGVGSQATSWLGGTPAQAVGSLLDTIKANTGFDQLQAMRNASPTGGALGPVSDMENRLLQSTLGSIDPKQPAPQLADNLKRLKNIYLDIIHGPGNGPYREKLSFPSQWDNYTAPPADSSVSVVSNLPAGVSEDDVQFTMKKYGVSRDEVLRRLGVH